VPTYTTWSWDESAGDLPKRERECSALPLVRCRPPHRLRLCTACCPVRPAMPSHTVANDSLGAAGLAQHATALCLESPGEVPTAEMLDNLAQLMCLDWPAVVEVGSLRQGRASQLHAAAGPLTPATSCGRAGGS